MSRICIILVMVAFTATSAFSEHYEISQTIETSAENIVFDRAFGYDVLRLPGENMTDIAGEPMMPSRTVRFAIPSDMVVTDIRLIEATGEVQLPGEYRILPVQIPRVTSFEDDEFELHAENGSIYKSGNLYPYSSVERGDQFDLAGQNMIEATVYPVKYNPSNGTVTVTERTEILIAGETGYECGDFLSDRVNSRAAEYLLQGARDMVANPEDVALQSSSLKRGISTVPEGTYEHVIISHSAVTTYLQPLVDWHVKRGLTDTLIDKDWIYANYAGADNQERIRNFVIDAYNNWGTLSILIAGEHSHIPFEYKMLAEETAPSDQYYSDFDEDWVNEVMVGRLTISSGTEATRAVEKIMQYEKNPARTNWAEQSLLIGMDLDGSTHCEYLMESIDGYIPSGFDVIKVYDSEGTNHRTEAINAWNGGVNLVSHCDHSYITSMGLGDRNHGWGIGNSNVDAFYNNNEMCITVSTGCHPNHMDYGDAISEHFVVYNSLQAGIGYIGNTRSGWYYPGDPYSLSNDTNRKVFLAIFNSGRTTLGSAFTHGKHLFTHSSDIKKQCEWEFCLLGEPSLPLWTANPDSFQLAFPDQVFVTDPSVLISVQRFGAGTPIEDALVCIMKEGELYETGLTDMSGQIGLPLSLTSSGVFHITVTADNYIPYETTVEILDYIPGDSDGSGEVDVDDAVHLITYIFNGGPAPNPLAAGDSDCSGDVDVDDAVHLINYIFGGGPEPGC